MQQVTWLNKKTRMVTKRLLACCIIFCALMVSGCAKKTTVILLPDPDGKVGHVTVKSDAGSVDIVEPAQATTVAGKASAPSPPRILSAIEIERDYSKILSVLPDPPLHFILYFETDTTLLTQQSIDEIPAILRAIHDRSSEDISVVGHSDTAGNAEYNMKLSTSRALAVSKLLVENGVSQNYLRATSHGENNPLIKTPDNTLEPKNRRVEVVIR